MPFNKKHKRRMLYVIGTITVGFLLLTAFVFFLPLSIIDREFSEEVQEHQNQFLDTVMKVISWFGYMPNSPIIVLGTAFMFFLAKYKREAIFVVLTLISGLVSSLVKLLINRPRPSQSLVRILEKTQQQSFPSGHVLFYVTFFGFLTLLMYQLTAIPKYLRTIIAVASLLLIFSIPFSRIYLGAHWFTDVLGGLLLGLLCLSAVSYLYLKETDRYRGIQN
ncbi:phosphatase PAP2 family protein [Mucilaginibacter sp.]|uniref:phosphatase PAP2 family protein n=1 Tax=Mucilaginibacter sp. TaxID=1882438 RepID=UPI0026036B5B|nr:phosphatase PAP2 family protein [Mucilaginibacter sp.]MDB5128546.1 phosphatase family protein [Mucilaginibacter sp.]